MSAYNAVNGTWAGQHRHLLTEVLRDEWGFTGFVMTDFIWGLRDPIGSVGAGQDLEMPFRQQRAAALPGALRDGRLARADVERAAARLLGAQVRLALRARPTPAATVVACPEHVALAREIARQGTVLLRNEPVGAGPALPLQQESLGRVAVLGPLADKPNLGDNGSSRVHPPTTTTTITILAGLRGRLGDRVVHVAHTEPAAAARAARDTDAAVVVVGLSAADEGESLVAADTSSIQLLGGIARFRPVAALLCKGMTTLARLRHSGGDRRDLRLHADDVALIRAVAAGNPRTIVVVIGGGTVVLDPWDTEVAWPGTRAWQEVKPLPTCSSATPSRAAGCRWLSRAAARTSRSSTGPPALSGTAGGGASASSTVTGHPPPTPSASGWATPPSASKASRPVRCTASTYPPRSLSPTPAPGPGGTSSRSMPACSGPTARPCGRWSASAPSSCPPARARVSVDCSTRPLQRWDGTRFVLDAGEVRLEAAAFSGDPAAATAVTAVPSWSSIPGASPHR